MKLKITTGSNKPWGNYFDDEYTFEIRSENEARVITDLENDNRVIGYSITHDDNFFMRTTIIKIKYWKYKQSKSFKSKFINDDTENQNEDKTL